MPFNSDQIRQMVRDQKIKKLMQFKGNLQVGEMVTIKNSPYFSALNGTRRMIVEIKYNHLSPGHHLYITSGPTGSATRFRRNELKKENQ